MAATTGTATLDFGAFPGASDAYVDVTGQTGFVSTSRREAYIEPAASADHSVDEHMLETIKVFATYFADGTMRIYGFNTSQVNEPLEYIGSGRPANAGAKTTSPLPSVGGKGTRIYGTWTVGWVWA